MLEGSVSRGLTPADINPAQNQAALQGVPSPAKFGKYKNLKATGKMPGVSVLVKNMACPTLQCPPGEQSVRQQM